MAGVIPDLPESLGPAKEYLIKAKQFQKISPVVAHYCKVYFLEKALEVRDKMDKAASAYLMQLMEEVEQEKSALGPVEDPKMQVEEMAIKVFMKADNQFYASKADINTAKAYRSASTIFEVCRQFGELDVDLAEKYKYAKVKARDIMLAAKEGRTLLPPQQEQDQTVMVAQPLSDDDDSPLPPPSHPPPPLGTAAGGARADFFDIPSVPMELPRVNSPPLMTHSPAPPPISIPPPAEEGPNSGHVSRTPKIMEVLQANAKPKAQIPTGELVTAEKHAKCALSALQFEDVRGAVNYLQQALALLTDAP
ncbi:Vta1 like-domain-containing protein [Baffinella frigidus]|nr:Vta1 like-domain-containing protein [Cryptophyta sp. CCMP2293]